MLKKGVPQWSAKEGCLAACFGLFVNKGSVNHLGSDVLIKLLLAAELTVNSLKRLPATSH